MSITEAASRISPTKGLGLQRSPAGEPDIPAGQVATDSLCRKYGAAGHRWQHNHRAKRPHCRGCGATQCWKDGCDAKATTMRNSVPSCQAHS